MKLLEQEFLLLQASAAAEEAAAIYLADELLVREPGLLIPKRHPLGPVKIDWQHPYTESLVGCWPLFNGTSAYVHDLTGNNHALAVNSDGSVKVATGPGGRGLENGTNASTSKMQMASIDSNNPLSCNANNEISIFAYVTFPTTYNNDFGRIVEKGTSTNASGGWSFFLRSGGAATPNHTLQLLVNGTAINPGDNFISSTTDYYNKSAGIGVSAASGDQDFVYNGYKVGSTSTSFTIPTTTNNASLTAAGSATDRNWGNKPIHLVCVWDTRVPTVWLQHLCNDPYLFLVPA